MLEILIVDDSKIARKRLIKTLDSFSMSSHITEAADGLEALEVLHTKSIDLLITDLEMPNMDGMTLIKELRKEDPTMHIIVVTTIANEKIKQLLKSDKYTDFMKKPYDTEVLKTYIKKVEHLLKKEDS